VRERYEHFRARCNSKKRLGSVSRTKKKIRKERGGHGTEKKKGKKRGKKELGCTEPLYEGEKAKCVLKIIPQKEKCDTMQIDSQCLKKKE